MGKKSSYVKKESLSKEEQRVVRETIAGKKNVAPVKEYKSVDPGFAIKVKGNYRDVDPGFYKTLPKRNSQPVRMPSPVIKKMSGK